jgi:hypothetical protein
VYWLGSDNPSHCGIVGESKREITIPITATSDHTPDSNHSLDFIDDPRSACTVSCPGTIDCYCRQLVPPYTRAGSGAEISPVKIVIEALSVVQEGSRHAINYLDSSTSSTIVFEARAQFRPVDRHELGTSIPRMARWLVISSSADAHGGVERGKSFQLSYRTTASRSGADASTSRLAPWNYRAHAPCVGHRSLRALIPPTYAPLPKAHLAARGAERSYAKTVTARTLAKRHQPDSANRPASEFDALRPKLVNWRAVLETVAAGLAEKGNERTAVSIDSLAE